MKNKAPLALMEQLVMILVFALAAALCLQMFVMSSTVSTQGAARDEAVTAVQNAAEGLKLCEGDFKALTSLLGGEADENGWQMDLIGRNGEMKISARMLEDENPLLGSALVCAENERGKLLFEVTVCWQEENDG